MSLGAVGFSGTNHVTLTHGDFIVEYSAMDDGSRRKGTAYIALGLKQIELEKFPFPDGMDRKSREDFAVKYITEALPAMALSIAQALVENADTDITKSHRMLGTALYRRERARSAVAHMLEADV
jgi:hypothetical protein